MGVKGLTSQCPNFLYSISQLTDPLGITKISFNNLHPKQKKKNVRIRLIWEKAIAGYFQIPSCNLSFFGPVIVIFFRFQLFSHLYDKMQFERLLFFHQYFFGKGRRFDHL